jgi:putative endopeptidase
MPNRDYYLEDRQGHGGFRTKYQAYVAAHCLKLAGTPTQTRRRKAIVALETKIAKAQESLGRERGRAQGEQPVEHGTTSRARRRASTGPRISRPPAGYQPSRSSGSRAPSPACRAGRQRAAGHLEGLSRFHTINHSAACCPRPSPTPASSSTATRCRARRSSAIAGSARSARVNNDLGDAVGQIYVKQYFPPRPRRRCSRWSRTSSPPSTIASTRWTG